MNYERVPTRRPQSITCSCGWSGSNALWWESHVETYNYIHNLPHLPSPALVGTTSNKRFLYEVWIRFDIDLPSGLPPQGQPWHLRGLNWWKAIWVRIPHSTGIGVEQNIAWRYHYYAALADALNWMMQRADKGETVKFAEALDSPIFVPGSGDDLSDALAKAVQLYQKAYNRSSYVEALTKLDKHIEQLELLKTIRAEIVRKSDLGAFFDPSSE